MNRLSEAYRYSRRCIARRTVFEGLRIAQLEAGELVRSGMAERGELVVVQLAPLSRWLVVTCDEAERFGAACGWEVVR